MSNEAGGTVPGSIRFGKEGSLEMYDGTEWAPLRRLSGTDLPPVMRDIVADQSSASGDSGGTGNAGDSGGTGDASDEAPA